MKAITVYFERNKKYRTLHKVFRQSAYDNGLDLDTLCIDIPDHDKKIKKSDHYYDCSYAHLIACDYLLNNPGDVAVCDSDLMIRRPLDDVLKYDFDIAVTVRAGIPYNTGIWFVKDTALAADFIELWAKNTRMLFEKIETYEDYIHSHGGIDQAALDYTIQMGLSTKILELPCTIWNACQGEWESVTDDTRVIHIKSKLRQACFGARAPEDYMIPLIEEWRKYL